MANVVKKDIYQGHHRRSNRGSSARGLAKIALSKSSDFGGLRRHPAGHFSLPRLITEEVELAGYRVPKGSIVNFKVSEMAWDPTVWEEPMKFKPERFLGEEGGGNEQEVFGITCTREIKMLPFGA
ncbi:Cytochrome P450 89A2-like protein [Drosera capensis]